MDQQSKLYAQMSQALRTGEHDESRLDAGPEFRLLEEAKDILDELLIMRDISLKQSTLLETLLDLLAEKWDESNREWDSTFEKRKEFFLQKKPRERFDVIRGTIKKADAAYDAIIHLIDMKQRQGSLLQAIAIRDLLRSNNQVLDSTHKMTESSQSILSSTNQTLQQSEKSGETLMVVSPFPLPGRRRVGARFA